MENRKENVWNKNINSFKSVPHNKIQKTHNKVKKTHKLETLSKLKD
jgi:hypothetical protein